MNKTVFEDLEKRLRALGLDSDSESFDVIRERLARPIKLSADAFARQCIYVIFASGFSQKTAKKIHTVIMDELKKGVENPAELIKIFNNKNKISAATNVWKNRQKYRDEYYKIRDSAGKLDYLIKLPHIGKITRNHLARNLGENVVKYDIWIQRLGVAFAKTNDMGAHDCTQKIGRRDVALHSKINNGKLDLDVKSACDAMFDYLERETGHPRGYIDVVLWKAAQNGLIAL